MVIPRGYRADSARVACGPGRQRHAEADGRSARIPRGYRAGSARVARGYGRTLHSGSFSLRDKTPRPRMSLVCPTLRARL
jgi:hypothetical protein